MIRVLAGVVGAVIGALVGFLAAIVLWSFFVEGGPEVPIAALAIIALVAVPIGVVAGGVVGWRLSRKRRG